MKSVRAVSFYTTELTKKQIDMGCLLNVLWHFPFFGFFFALVYALLGLFMCCTVVLLPVGLGYLQFARFLLTPFSCAMVSRSDLEKITGEKQNSAMATFSLVIQILYFPIGCFAAVGALCMTIAAFLSIFGIPFGLVWAKSLATIFNPVNKVCVPKAVGDEIERLKSAATLSKYTGQNPNAQANVQANAPAVSDSSALEEENRRKNRPQVRTFDDNRLAEVVNNQEMYNAELVAQCTREIEIRRKSEALSEKVAAFDDGKLREIMSGAGVYSDELIYSCEKEYDHRAQLKREEMARAAEQARIEREKEAEAEAEAKRAAAAAARERRILWWKKWRAVIYSAVLLLIISGIAIYFYRKHAEQVRIEQEHQLEMARERLEEQRRLEDEQRRLEDEQRMKREKQEAEARRREQQRVEAERLKEEQARRLEEERIAKANRIKAGIFEVGDLHPGLNGIVYYVYDKGKHGRVISLDEVNMRARDGKVWAESKGLTWRMAKIDDLKSVRGLKNRLNEALSQNGGVQFQSQCYWVEDIYGAYRYNYNIGSGVAEKTTSGESLSIRAIGNF